MRWAWIGLAIVSTVGYLWVNPLVTIEWYEEGEDRAGPEKDDEAKILEDGEVGEEEELVDTGVEDDGIA